MVSLGVHPSLSMKHKFWESRNANGSDSVTQNLLEVCQQSHRSVTGHNTGPVISRLNVGKREVDKRVSTLNGLKERETLTPPTPSNLSQESNSLDMQVNQQTRCV